jgi:hypothetical protein
MHPSQGLSKCMANNTGRWQQMDEFMENHADSILSGSHHSQTSAGTMYSCIPLKASASAWQKTQEDAWKVCSKLLNSRKLMLIPSFWVHTTWEYSSEPCIHASVSRLQQSPLLTCLEDLQELMNSWKLMLITSFQVHTTWEPLLEPCIHASISVLQHTPLLTSWIMQGGAWKVCGKLMSSWKTHADSILLGSQHLETSAGTMCSCNHLRASASTWQITQEDVWRFGSKLMNLWKLMLIPSFWVHTTWKYPPEPCIHASISGLQQAPLPAC